MYRYFGVLNIMTRQFESTLKLCNNEYLQSKNINNEIND